MMQQDWKRIVARAREQGWRVVDTRDGVMLLAPNGTGKVTIHGTPSDRRAIQNALADLRREGDFMWPPLRNQGRQE